MKNCNIPECDAEHECICTMDLEDCNADSVDDLMTEDEYDVRFANKKKILAILVGSIMVFGSVHFIIENNVIDRIYDIFEEPEPDPPEPMDIFIYPHNTTDSGFTIDSWDMIDSWNFTFYNPDTNIYHTTRWDKDKGWNNETGIYVNYFMDLGGEGYEIN